MGQKVVKNDQKWPKNGSFLEGHFWPLKSSNPTQKPIEGHKKWVRKWIKNDFKMSKNDHFLTPHKIMTFQKYGAFIREIWYYVPVGGQKRVKKWSKMTQKWVIFEIPTCQKFLRKYRGIGQKWVKKWVKKGVKKWSKRPFWGHFLGGQKWP